MYILLMATFLFCNGPMGNTGMQSCHVMHLPQKLYPGYNYKPCVEEADRLHEQRPDILFSCEEK